MNTKNGVPDFTVLTYTHDDKELELFDHGDNIKICQGDHVVIVSSAQAWALVSILENII